MTVLTKQESRTATPGVLPRLLGVLNAPWAILPDKLLEIREIYRTHLRGEKIDLEAVRAQLGQPLHNTPRNYVVQEGVAILPIEGIIAKRMNLFTQISGGVSTQLLERDFRAALADPAAHSVLLLIDSPGGEVDGTQVLSDLIFESRGVKPIWTLGDSLMASAGVWIGSAGQKIYISDDTTQVGSIGVVATHLDVSEQDRMFGVKVTEITAGRYKRVASEHEPLSDAGRQFIQDQVDHVYSVFVDSIARNRGVTTETVLQDMADGRIFLGQQAIAAGLVDGVATLPEVIAMLNGKSASPGRTATQEPVAGSSSKNPTFEVIEVRAIDEPPTTKGVSMAEPNKEQAPATAVDVEAVKIAEYRRGVADGATAERDRIKAVYGKSMPGHEALVRDLMFDGSTTGPQAAEAILEREKEKRAAVATQVKSEAPPPVKPTATADGSGNPPAQPAKPDRSHLPIEKRCELEWEEQPALRDEFTNLKAYIASERALASGDARIFGRKVQ